MVDVDRRFRGAIALMMETVSSSETKVNIYQTIRRNIPEHNHLHTRLREKPEISPISIVFTCIKCKNSKENIALRLLVKLLKLQSFIALQFVQK
jgi:hypothetical protein